MIYDVIIDNQSFRLELERSEGQWQCRVNGQPVSVDAVLARRDVLSIIIGGKAYEIKRERTATEMHVWVGPRRYDVQLRDPRSLRGRARADDGKGLRKLIAPMPGKVVRVLLKEQAQVEAGQGVVVV